jgi:uncharacterized membrane protein YgcG
VFNLVVTNDPNIFVLQLHNQSVMFRAISTSLPDKRTAIKSLFLNSLACLLFSCFIAHAQDKMASNTHVSLNVHDVPFQKVLAIIEQQSQYKFAYSTELILKQKNITIEVHDKPLDELILMVLKGTNINYSIIDNQIILEETTVLPRVTISGYIKDSQTGETLPGAIIYFPEKKTGTYANNYGFYSITQNQADSLDVMISYVGFNKINQKVNIGRSLSKNFFLTENKIEINPIIITRDDPDDNVKKNQPGKTDVSMEMIRAVPSINGTGDIINTIQMLPGVIAGLDGRPGYFIRGGNADQNLVQLDEATLYNPNHLLGLVSIFNSSAIKSATLLKGGFPASYGDHLSSVLDVTIKDGNNQQIGGDIQLGTIAGGFTLSGPVTNKASFFVSARRSTIDFYMKPLNFSNYYSNYYFYDVNAKLNFQLSQRDRIYLSLYQGRDYSAYTKDSTASNAINYGINFGNQAVTFRWNHLYSQKLFSNTSNNYYQSLTASQQPYYAELYSGIRDFDFKTDLNYYPNINHKISAGINALYQTLFPAMVSDKAITKESVISINPLDIPRKYASRFAVYFSDEVWLAPKLSAYIGARLPLFYKDNVQYLQFEPRLSLLYMISPTSSIKVSYTQMHQYLHLVQCYNASFPADIWIGSSKSVRPQKSQQATIGLFKNFKENMFQSSLEIYYKQLDNQLLFKGSSNPVINNNIENSLIFGQGQTYGTELFFKKNRGKLTGWLAYTFAFSNQQFDSLNLGRPFPSANDRRHSAYVVLSYALNEHWEITSNILFTSGRAFTLNKSDSGTGNNNPLYYEDSGGSNSGSGGSGSSGSGSGNSGNSGGGPGSGSGSGSGHDSDGSGSGVNNATSSQIVPNNYRLAPYNRVDISMSYRKKRNLPHRVIETEWVLSVYNVYAHSNTYFAYSSIDPVTKQPIAKQVSFVPIIPSISYNLKF